MIKIGFFGSNQIALPQPKVAFENHMRTQDRFRGPEVQDSFYQNRFRSPVSRQKRPERLPAASMFIISCIYSIKLLINKNY
jgi:hypothetical protein